ncbi:iron uptake porin [Aphanothece sacrum]|nr:iron uptake porin [Aphanothece sacrum]
MSKFLWPVLLMGSVMVGSTSLTPVQANEPIASPVSPSTVNPRLNQVPDYEKTLHQLNSIQQLRDVSPVDWSYQALKNLVENYGCIVGYPDQTYRGDRPLSRNEFAAGLNACLEQLERRLLEAKSQGQGAYQRTQPGVQAIPTEPGDHVINVFNRAFYNETGRFYESTDISGQMNNIFGWRTSSGSYFDNQIASDGETFETIYHDALRQQTAGPRIRTPDISNPFNTSLTANPEYIRTQTPGASEIYIRQQQIPIMP